MNNRKRAFKNKYGGAFVRSLDTVFSRWKGFCAVKNLRGKLSCFEHREHTILLSRERVNKGTKRMNSLRLPPHLISSILRDFTGKTTAYKSCVTL